ncbi:unnamed protein product [Arctia plantaginis]|uniref:Uncharacterized protein n=1 Tax=Arctia plantaginis TaxID=874455 RepID=A0A8S1AS35_ARCPL|nr:unnamed protein product [Arctia plantaginis]CAB3247628.1 unnamed protein product [Arctia plantaginis]
MKPDELNKPHCETMKHNGIIGQLTMETQAPTDEEAIGVDTSDPWSRFNKRYSSLLEWSEYFLGIYNLQENFH